MLSKPKTRNPWAWVPTLYYGEGIPYVIVMTVSVIMYKRLNLSNSEIALYTSWLYLPWVLKPLWSPMVDMLRTKRYWIIAMQLTVGAGLAGVALTIPTENYVRYTLAFFWLLAFSSATHDIAADGFYMLGLNENQQTFFVGIRSTFYRFAMITGQGLLIILAGYLEGTTGLTPLDIHINAASGLPPANEIALMQTTPSTAENNLRLYTDLNTISVPLGGMVKDSADAVVHQVAELNYRRGFTAAQPAALKPGAAGRVGSIAVGYVRLSQMPQTGKEITVSLEHHSGDKSISVIEGNRLTFSGSNWQQPALYVVQTDARLKEASSAVFQARAGNNKLVWTIIFWCIAGLFVLLGIYHKFILPHPDSDVQHHQQGKNMVGEFFRTFELFFKKEKILLAITFLLIYRFGEAQIVKMASPFLLDPRSVGGLELPTGQVGFIYGTVGVLALTLGGILGGIVASRHGLKYWLWWMFLAINIPHLLYVYLAFAQPDNLFVINLCVAGEQFGYGFGFTAYMLYMIYISEGEYKTAFFAICTAFMALSMMIPGLFSGYLQEWMGYKIFFLWILVAMIPGYFIVEYVSRQVNPDFGRKNKKIE